MPIVTLLPSNKKLLAEIGESIYQVVRKNGVPLGSSCGGDGICDKCRVTITNGSEFLSSMNDAEKIRRGELVNEHGWDVNERVACQAIIYGDIEITTGYW